MKKPYVRKRLRDARQEIDCLAQATAPHRVRAHTCAALSSLTAAIGAVLEDYSATEVLDVRFDTERLRRRDELKRLRDALHRVERFARDGVNVR